MSKAKLFRVSKTELEFVHPNGVDKERYPFDYENTLKVRDYCKQNGIRVVVEERLKDWIKNETAKRNWPFDLIPVESPLGIALSQRPFQRDSVDFVQKHKSVLIADEPGLGKTLQAISSVIQAGITGSVLIVAPKTAAYVTWPHELETWFNDVAPYDEWIIIGGDMTKLQRIRAVKRALLWDMGKKRTGPRQWIIVSPNYLRIKAKLDRRGNYEYDDDGSKIYRPVREAIPALLAFDWKAIIIDEAHQTLSGAQGEVKKQSAQRQGLGLLETSPDALRIAVTGTPFRGKHENLWGILNWLYPNDFRHYWPWVDRHFKVFVDPLSNQRIVGDVKDMDKLQKELSNIMIRRTKQEVAKELPPKRYGGTPLRLGNGKDGPIAVWLEMSGQQKKAYEQMVQSAMAELEGGTLMANGVLAEMIRLKQFANSYGFIGGTDEFFPTFPSNKFDWIVDFLGERGIDGNGPGESKVIISSQFTKHVDLFAERLRNEFKIPVFSLTGATSADERVRLQRDFQRNQLEDGSPAPDVFFINTMAGGTAITLDAADDVVIIDSTFNHDDQEQVENRAHRLSRLDHNVTIWNLASTNSIDESIARHTHMMDTSIKQILDGERGIDFAKMLLSDAM
jgi:SNF2 family DNA or RNA helicase